MQRIAALLAVAACAALLRGAAAAQSDVVNLDPTSFPKMLKSDRLWMVEFFAPWCGHCKALAPEWAKAAGMLKGVVSMGAVDMDQHQSLGQPYGIQGFPTIKLFGANKKSPTDYNGQRTAKGLVDAAMKMVKDTVNARTGGGSGGSGGSKGPVVTLTEGNFKKEVMESTDLWLVEFYAPWCGHCKNLEPHWKAAAKELKGQVKMGAVDATVHQGLAQKYGVQGYPTIKVFPAGKKGKPLDYQGGRETAGIVEYARSLYQESLPPPEVSQLADSTKMESDCSSKQICFIAFLPHILDTDAASRKAAIATLQANADNFKMRPFGWVWAEAGAQSAMEQAFDVGGAGFPALVALNSKKNKFASHRGAFDERAIKDFVNQLVAGRAGTASLSGGVPSVSTTEPWDGKDGAPIEAYEEEFDLSELDDVEEDTHTEL